MPKENPRDERLCMELLAPAGGYEQLRYALHFGADAVYIGGERFGLRVRADNFSDPELASGIAFAHELGKKVYVAANSLLHPADVEPFRDYVEQISDCGADAVIVSDLAAIAIVRETAPNLAIHLSTQASCTNALAAREYAALGVSRIVLARELTLAEIKDIRTAVPEVELEVFVHGSMCIAYSGRCLISNYLVGRDANRGNCTQPCRWSYSLQEQSRPGEYFPIEEDGAHTFILSSADLNMIEHLSELEDAGVDSIKIEGRVKGAYYVATVTQAYRRVLDGESPSTVADDLETVSHRPYHTGFFYGTPAQSYEGSEYSQTCTLIGGISTCTQIAENSSGDPRWQASLALRNRFFTGDELEVLSPHHPVRKFIVTAIEDEDGLPVRVADRTCETYTLTVPFPLEKLDILRKRVSGS